MLLSIVATAAVAVIIMDTPGGFPQLLQFAEQHDKLRVFDFDFDFFKPTMTFWAGLVGGAFLSAATHGTDQLMVQRYLSARNQRDASRALAISGLIVSLQFALFLLIGVGLAGFYSLATAAAPLAGGRADELFAGFIVNHMPAGLVGFTLAAVFAAAMSTLSSSLNSSATVLVNDIYLPMLKREMPQRGQLRAGRIATLVFGLLQIMIAILVGLVGSDESTVASVLKIAGFAAGPVLGLYLLAVFARSVGQAAALAGFLIGVVILSAVAVGTDLYWPWYSAVGAVSTFVIGWLIQALLTRLLLRGQ